MAINPTALLAATGVALDDSPESRVAAWNAAQRALAELVRDVSDDPACAPQLVPADRISGNDYNPNRVAPPELDLLQESIEADGVTMPIVAMQCGESWVVIDGFHRHTVLTDRLGREYIPCSIIDRSLAERMASTIRHNRARGKHQVDLMAILVRNMIQLGWNDSKISTALGMSPEELLRLRQMVGAAKFLAGDEYSRSWGTVAERSVDE